MSTFEVPPESRKKYLARRLLELDQLEESQDLEFAKKLGHQIKGNAATFLFPSLTELGSGLEAAAIAQDEELMRKIAFDLRVTLQRLFAKV